MSDRGDMAWQVLLIDVRSPDQYHASHIQYAVNFPCNRVHPPTLEDIMGDTVLQDSLVMLFSYSRCTVGAVKLT